MSCKEKLLICLIFTLFFSFIVAKVADFFDFYLNLEIVYNIPIMMIGLVFAFFITVLTANLLRLKKTMYIFTILAIISGVLTLLSSEHSQERTNYMELNGQVVYIQEITDGNNSGHYNVYVKRNVLFCEKIETIWYNKNVVVDVTFVENDIIVFSMCKDDVCWDIEIDVGGDE